MRTLAEVLKVPAQNVVPAWHNMAVWLSFGIIFLCLELPPVFWVACPWNTLSGADWRFLKWWHGGVYFLALCFFVLSVHMLLRVPVRYLITAVVGMLVALAFHLAWDKI